jgi:hypothetical protein
MVVTSLATAERPDAKACAPVPGRLEAIATVRGKALLVLLVGLQSSFAAAKARKLPRGPTINASASPSEIILAQIFLPMT